MIIKVALKERPLRTKKEHIRLAPELYTESQRDLLSFMDSYGLSRSRLAALTGYSINTVHAWFFKPGAAGYRNLSERKLNLIKAQVREKLLYSTRILN